MPVVPATQEAEAGESREPRRQRFQWAKITPLHSRLGDKGKIQSQKNKYLKKLFLCPSLYIKQGSKSKPVLNTFPAET